MTPADSLTFLCPACGIKLTVPSSAAGAVGPCPGCRVNIQAPQLAVPATLSPLPTPRQPAAPPEATAPTAEEHQRPAYRPEPRQLPSRTGPAEPTAKPISEQHKARPIAGSPGPPPRSHRPNPLSRVLIPLTFLSLAVLLVYGLVVLLNQDKPQPVPASPPTTTTTQPTTTVPPKETTGVAPATDPEPVAAVKPKKGPDIAAAEATLRRFLEASTLAERMPLMELRDQPRNKPEKLATSCLAAKLKPFSQIKYTPVFQTRNESENFDDCYFTVAFGEDESKLDWQTLLVRIRGTQAPVIVADPFLDLYGGDLERYAKSPKDTFMYFQVLVSAISLNPPQEIPDHDKKDTMRLLAADDSKVIATAYFAKSSKIHDMLSDSSSGLLWGNSKPCRVMLCWNQDAGPDKAFLEVLDIVDLDWNYSH